MVPVRLNFRCDLMENSHSNSSLENSDTIYPEDAAPAGDLCPQETTGQERTIPGVLLRLSHNLILAAIALSALVYPFRLPDSLLAAWDHLAESGNKWGLLYFSQLRPQLAFGHSPLLYKEVLSQVLLLGAIGAFLVSKLIELSGQKGHPLERRALLRNPVSWLTGFILYAGVSALFFSPTLHYSIRTWMESAIVILALCTLLDGRAGRGFRLKLMWMMIFCGAIIATISVLQQLRLTSWFLPFWDDPRNRLGSLIGHNTGLSSWLLFPLSFSLYFALSKRGLVARAFCSLMAVLMLYVIIAAESRAVWLIVLTTGIPYVVQLLRNSGRRIRLRTFLLGFVCLMAVIAVQTIAPNRNPFARHVVSLADRVKNHILNPEQLLHETRLRILAASGSLVAKHPVQGSGYGSFQYVYPPAQGEYFRNHPDSRLGTTNKRSDLAHDDYLQLLIEAGFVGVLLLFIPVVMLFKRGWRNYRLLRGNSASELLAILFPVMGVCLQAFVDFPFHIMPIALAAGCCFVLWCSAGDSERFISAPKDESTEEPARTYDFSNVRPAPTAALIATVSFCIVIYFAVGFLLQDYMADIYTTEGSGWRRTAGLFEPGQRMQQYRAYGTAKEDFKKALKLNPFSGEAYEGLIYTLLNLASTDMTMMHDAIAAGQTSTSVAWKASAERNLELALVQSQNQRAHGELEYHFSLYQIGEIYNLLWRLNRNITNYRDSAERAYRMALEMNPADSYSLFKLAELLDMRGPATAAAAEGIKARLFGVDPEFAYRMYVQPVVDAGLQGDFTTAYLKLDQFGRLAPDEWRLKCARAELLTREATWPPAKLDGPTTSTAKTSWKAVRISKADKILEQLAESYPEEPRVLYLYMYELATRGNYSGSLRIADELSARFIEDRDLQIFRHRVARKAGVERPIWDYRDDTYYWHIAYRYYLFYLDEQYRGALQLARYSKSIDLELNEGLRATAFLRASNNLDLASLIVQNLSKNYRQNANVARLKAELKIQ
jgi:O-antigen ligase